MRVYTFVFHIKVSAVARSNFTRGKIYKDWNLVGLGIHLRSNFLLNVVKLFTNVYKGSFKFWKKVFENLEDNLWER